MKRILLLVLFISVLKIELAAQTIPKTSGQSICKCAPAGWNTGYLSNRTYYGSLDKPFVGLLPTFPGTPVLPPIPSGESTFLGLYSGITQATISNLVIGQKYKFTYSVISAMIESFNPDYPNRNFTGGINFSVNNPGIGFNEVLAVHKHDFAGPDEEPIEWRTGVFEFTPKATTAILQVEIIQEADDDNEYGVVGLDLGPNTVVPCIAGTQAVPLKATSHEILCPETSVNLVSQFFGGLIPSGTELKFFTNPNHTGLPLSNLNVGAGTYYAFYYDAANNCYNQDVSTAKIDVTYKNCADVTQTLDISAANFSLGVSRDFVVNLYEINGSGTAGPVTFKIGKPGGFTITYPTVSGVSKIFGDVPNENGKWTFSENAGFITATSSEPIPANGQATIGFRVARKAGIAAGLSQNITITVVGGSGGELNTENNLSITTVSTN